VPLGVGIGIAPFLHDDLDEGARLGRLLPRGGALAGRKAHDDVADTALFSGPELDLARDVVALVEQAEDGDPLGHWRADPAAGRDDRRGFGQLVGNLGLLGLRRRRLGPAGAEEQKDRRDREPPHASGVQAS